MKLTILLFAGMMLHSLTFYGQEPRTGHKSLFICSHYIAPSLKKELKSEGYQFVEIIYQNYIDPDHDMIADRNILKARIEKLFPGKQDAGIAILDWEAPGLGILEKQTVSDADYNRIIDNYRKTILYAKHLRPNVKWGYYGLPMREYHHRNSRWRAKAFKLIELFTACDFLAPSLYDFFPDFESKGRDSAYVKENVQLTLEIGKELDKPVMPFVWHRWHDSHKKYGLQLIPVPELIRHLSHILLANYDGKQIDGIIWWSEDRFFFNKNKTVLKEEVRDAGVDYDLYEDQQFHKYVKVMDSIFNRF